jgi:2,5-diamino-6-(ribosylamino)-4(3H)-pyrimidinone 5'-phosphate reductase
MFHNSANAPLKPFVFINAAMSADGKIATIARKQKKISGAIDFDRVDELKASSDAVMVGIGTILSDNPSLTVKSAARKEKRLANGLPENPVRIVVDSMARTPTDADILKKGDGRRIIVVSGNAPLEKVNELSHFAEIITVGGKRADLAKLMAELKARGINHLMVEGGGTLNWGLISEGLVDEIYVFIGNIIFGGSKAPTLVDGDGNKTEICKLSLISCERLEEGVLMKWKVAH